MRSLAPIVFFAYNRPHHTRLVLESLHRNKYADESSLYIYLDGPPPDASEEILANIAAVKKIVHEKNGVKKSVL